MTGEPQQHVQIALRILSQTGAEDKQNGAKKDTKRNNMCVRERHMKKLDSSLTVHHFIVVMIWAAIQ